MTRLEPLTPETARGKSKDLLTDLVNRNGQVGEMVQTMAHSPAVLGGYLDLSRAMKRTKLKRTLSERISLAVQQQLGCSSCLAAHIETARAVGIDDEEIALARQATSADPDIAVLINFGLRVYKAPATISATQISELQRRGYSDREIADVVGIVALNVLTGAFNLVAGIHSSHSMPMLDDQSSVALTRRP